MQREHTYRDFTPCQEDCLIIAPKLIPDLTVNMKQNSVGGGYNSQQLRCLVIKEQRKADAVLQYIKRRVGVFFFLRFLILYLF